MKHRLQLSWQAFHRLHTFLCSRKLEVGQRLRLWRACVLSVARYGLTAIRLDEVSASKLRSHVCRQLRIIAGNPAHLTHETNASLATRYSVKDPVQDLYQKALRRIEQSRQNLLHMQSSAVQQRWSQLLSDFATQVVRIQCSCDVCGQQFGSFHALRTHVGKAHPELSVALTKSSYPERSARKDDYIRRSVDGRPHCKHCQKQFSGWPAYMSHFNQKACPAFHMPSTEGTSPADISPAHGTHASGTDTAEDDSVPIFHRSDTIAIAKQGLIKPLAAHIRGLCRQNYCPECGVKCKTPMYVSRHATKLHASIKEANPKIIDWARNCQVPANPCTWCGDSYKTQAKAHRRWSCGHLLNRRSALKPPGQTTLSDDHSSQRGGASQSDAGAQRLCRLRTVNPKHPGCGGLNYSSSSRDGDGLLNPVDSAQKRKEDQGNQAAAQQRTKWPKGPGKGQGYNQDKKQKQQQQWWGDSRNHGSSHSSDDLKNIVRAMGRLLIRQEDSLSILQQDTQLVVFLKNREQGKPASEDWSIVQALFLVGKRWREQKEKSPNQVTQPLRVVLLGSMLDAILNRVKQLETDPALREVAEKRGLVVNGTFPFLQWDQEKKEYQASSQPPLSFKEVTESLSSLKMRKRYPASTPCGSSQRR